MSNNSNHGDNDDTNNNNVIIGDIIDEFIITIQLEKWNTTERTLNRANRCI